MKISKDQVNYASILFLILNSDHQMAAQKAIQQVLVEVEKWFLIKKKVTILFAYSSFIINLLKQVHSYLHRLLKLTFISR